MCFSSVVCGPNINSCVATKEGTIDLKSRMFRNGGKMTFWKVVILNGHYSWKMGIHTLKARKIDWGRHDISDIYSGFIVYCNKNDAIKDIRSYRKFGDLRETKKRCIVEVECDVSDLLGANIHYNEYVADEASFKKIEVTKTERKLFSKN